MTAVVSPTPNAAGWNNANVNITVTQDEFSIMSYKRAIEAIKNCWFKDEIVPVSIPQKAGEPLLLQEDEEPKKVKFEKIATLKPAFQKDGTVTAANASKLNDGAAAVILMSKEKADQLGIKPIARIRGFADAQQAPESVLEQQILLAVEVEVERPFRHPGGRADRVDGRGIDAVLEKEPVGRLANGGSRALASWRRRLPGAAR